MGFLDYGQGAQAFMDNFLKTKLGLEEGNRQQLEAARRQEMFLQKQREQQEYAELMSKINSPAMAEVKNPNAFNVVSNNKPVPNDFLNFVQTGQNPQGFLQPQDNNPTIQKQFPSQVEAWQAQKLDPEKEIFNRSLAIQTKYDPTEAIKTRASLIRTDENNDTKMDLLRERLGQSLSLFEKTNDMKWQMMAQGYQNQLNILRERDKLKDGDVKPTDSDKIYGSYLAQFNTERQQGLQKGRPMNRYEFALWYDKQKGGGNQPNVQIPIQPVETKPQQQPTTIKYDSKGNRIK